MRFAPTEEQELLRKSVADVLRKVCTPEEVRAAWTGDGRSRGRWRSLAELGVLAMGVSEQDGGVGASAVDLALVLEETGRVALPEPIVETAAVVAPMLAESANDATRTRWLGALLDGSATAAIALEGRLVVSGAAAADVTIVERLGALFAVPREQLRCVPERSVDGARRLATLEGEPSPAACLAEGPAARRAIRRAAVRGSLGTAAQLIGLARAMLEQTVDYVKVRHQFGVPIGSFQAVKHHLADAAIQLEFARPLVLHAAWALTRGEPDCALRVSLAKAAASDAATLVARKALQCHGAIGYSYEHPLHLWMKRSWALAKSWGDAPEHRARVARVLLDGESQEEW